MSGASQYYEALFLESFWVRDPHLPNPKHLHAFLASAKARGATCVKNFVAKLLPRLPVAVSAPLDAIGTGEWNTCLVADERLGSHLFTLAKCSRYVYDNSC